MKNEECLPLISIIIPAFNYARFLPKAIHSALHQTYRNVEVMVIDDGSTDDTETVVQQYPEVQYYYQQNKGLSAARNAGIKKSHGDYLVFLDADDWLEKDALANNYAELKGRQKLAFVSGNYYFLRAATNKLHPVTAHVSGNYYRCLLQSNYIGMHATVMFQRWVFNVFSYDENLKACEDYDLYLNISRSYPVLHHDKFIATYYFHAAGLSHNYEAMADAVKTVIEKQKPYVKTAAEKFAYKQGLQQWRDYKLLEQSLQL